MKNRVSELRNKHGYSQEELANKLGVSQQAVSNIENEVRKTPSIDICIKIAEVFDVNVEYLFYKNDCPVNFNNLAEFKHYSDRVKRIVKYYNTFDTGMQKELESFMKATATQMKKK